MSAFGVQFWFMTADPQDLTGGESCKRRIRSNLNEPLAANKRSDLLTLLRGSPVAPDNAAPKRLASLVKHDKPMHLSRKANPLDRFGRHAAFIDHPADRRRSGLPPIGWFLLRPTILWLIERVFNSRGRYGRSVLVKQNCFRSGSAKINTNQIIHRFIPFRTGQNPRRIFRPELIL